MTLILPLTPDQQNRLYSLLAEQGSTILEREQLLESAGLAALLPKIDLNTPAEQFATQAVRVAQRYGAVAPHTPALLLLLKQLRDNFAGQAETVAFLDTLLVLPSTEAELPDEEEDDPTIDNDINDVEGDVIIANVVVGKGTVAPDITVGKNIIKIGKFVFPIWMFVVALALPFVLAGITYLAVVPAKMPNNASQFNVAVATFGELRNGRMQNSDTAHLLGEWVAEGLTQEKPVYDAAFGNPIEVWYDGLSPLIKRTTIGMIDGATPQTRQSNAGIRAADLNANVIVYGYVEPQSDGRNALTIEFYVNPDLNSPVEARFGSERMGDPITLPANFDSTATGTGNSATLWETVINRGRSLAWIIRTLDRERRGLKSEMLRVIEQAEAATTSTETGRLLWPERGAGKEVIYTLKGEAQLELAYADTTCGAEYRTHADLAEAAFRQAFASNANYALAHIGLGNIDHAEAQCLLATVTDSAQVAEIDSRIQSAFANYQRAQQLAAETKNPYESYVAQISLAVATRLHATLLLQQSRIEPENAPALISDALAQNAAGLALLNEVLSQPPQEEYYYRLLARAYLIQGNIFALQALAHQQQGDSSAVTTDLQAAVDAFTQCEEQAKKVFVDVYLQETLVPNNCTPQKETTLRILAQGAP